MKTLRVLVRLPLILLSTALFFVIWATGLMPSKVMGKKPRWRAFIFRRWARLLMLIMGVRVTVRGVAPKPPFLLISNHVSYFDIPLLASQADTIFVAKQEVSGWPVIGFLCRAMDTVFINRTSRRDILRVSQQMRSAFELGQGIVVFPEGTTTDGTSVAPFRPSLLEVPVRLQEPVRYASVSYETRSSDPPAETAVCWWGDMTLAPHFFGLLGLKGFDAELSFGEKSFLSDDRKQLAQELRDAISSMLELNRPYGELQCL